MTDRESVVLVMSAHEAEMASKLLQRLTKDGRDSPDEFSKGELHAYADMIYYTRRQRTRFFSPDLFAEPAWDILLALYCGEAEEKEIRVSYLTHSADVPATTALRWIDTLEKEGLICRSPHKKDRRVLLVNLTDEARRQIEGCLGRAMRKQRDYFTQPALGRPTVNDGAGPVA